MLIYGAAHAWKKQENKNMQDAGISLAQTLLVEIWDDTMEGKVTFISFLVILLWRLIS